MSDERETPAVTDPGAPVEELSTTDTSVQDAVDRAAAIADETAVTDSAADSVATVEAGESTSVVSGSDAVDSAEAQRRVALSQVDTEIDLERPTAQPTESAKIAEFVEMPSAAGAAGAAAVAEAPVRDGEIRISADHPMASLYMQTPTPPDLKGNRGAGVLITLVATVAFAVLYAGIVAVWLAPTFPPSTFVNEGLLPWVTSWGFIAAVAAFFVGMLVLVLIFNRAGWWAYVIFSLFVGVLVWFAAAGTFTVTEFPGATATELSALYDSTDSQIEKALAVMKSIGFTLPVLGAAIAAREVAIWFGAWIGARGRKVRAKNAELLAEYEVALAEVQAQK